MKLELTQKFSLEIFEENKDDLVITGYITPLSKQQQKEIKQTFEKEQKEANDLQKKSVKLQRFAIKVSKAETKDDENIENLYKTLDKMTLDVENLTTKIQENDIKDKLSQSLFNSRVKSNDIEKLKDICGLVGYSKVMKTIQKDIDAGKSKDSANS